MRKVYLDYAAASPVDPRVMEEMLPFFTEKFGNPSSLHFEGDEATGVIEDCRAKIAALIGAESREIIFTSGATEAGNLALIIEQGRYGYLGVYARFAQVDFSLGRFLALNRLQVRAAG